LKIGNLSQETSNLSEVLVTSGIISQLLCDIKKPMNKIRSISIVLVLMAISVAAQQGRTQVVLLGTGTPNPDPDRFGPSVAIVVDNQPYVVDCGPGVVRRASAAFRKGIKGLDPVRLDKLFITHLHSDHTTGYADFLLTPAVLERKGPLLVFGPVGTEQMATKIASAYQPDFDIRISGLEEGDPSSYKTRITEIKEGLIY
jgi:ribonuclease BN (tRNA processing enzyme)